MACPTSCAVSAGCLATAAQYNNLRCDALTHTHCGNVGSSTIAASTFTSAVTFNTSCFKCNTPQSQSVAHPTASHIDLTSANGCYAVGLTIEIDATCGTGGNKVGAMYDVITSGGGCDNIFGINPLVELNSGATANAIAIEADVNNKSGTCGKGVGILVNGASSSKIAQGIILRMNAGAAGGQVGLLIEDDWDTQIQLEGANTNTKWLHQDGGGGTDAQLDINQTPCAASNNARVRWFRETNAACARMDVFKGDCTATRQITLYATEGRVEAVSGFLSTEASVCDDGITCFTPFHCSGILTVHAECTCNNGAMVVFKGNACPATAFGWNVGCLFEAATGALVGTTGTDGKITVSADACGKLYIENRSGAGRIIRWALMPG